MQTRRYTAFISYRHADNTQEGRRWAEWLHRALEHYVVPPDLIGTPNLREEPIRDSLYPVFRDQNELPASADLATGIRAALEVSDYLVIICSPRSAVSPWVQDEVRQFKELGHSGRILAVIIAGEPNASADGKAGLGIFPEEECFCKELRSGVPREDGSIDWTARTEPIAADLRPVGVRSEGYVTADAYRDHLVQTTGLTPEQIASRVEAYRKQLDQGLLQVIAGLLGVRLSTLVDRDAVHRATLAEQEAAKQRQIAERERQLAEQAQHSAEEANRAKLATERTARRLAIAGAGALVLALLTGWFWWQAGMEKNEANRQRTAVQVQAENARAALVESNRQLERSQVEEGRAWLERGRAAENKGEYNCALLLAGRAIGYAGYGRLPDDNEAFPELLSRVMNDPIAERDRSEEANLASKLINSINPTLLPLWASSIKEIVTCVAFSPDSIHLATGFGNKTIMLWEASTGKELASLQGHTDRVTSVAFSPDGNRVASCSDDNKVIIWDVDTGKQLVSFLGHTDDVNSVAFSPDGRSLASGSADKTIKVWDAATGKELARFQRDADWVQSIAFSPDGRCLATGSFDKTIKLWDAATGEQLAILQGHTDPVLSIAFSFDGSRLVSGSMDKTIKLWETATGKQLESLQTHTESVCSVVFSPDGSRLASGSFDKTIKLWDAVTGREIASFQGHRGQVTGVAFSPDGSRLASGSADNTLRLWDTHNGKLLSPIQAQTDDLNSVALSPDGVRLAVWSAKAFQPIKLWDTAYDKDVASDPAENTIKLWDAVTGKELASFQGQTVQVTGLAFSPDGSQLAISSFDNTIKLWDATTGKELASPSVSDLAVAKQVLAAAEHRLHTDGQRVAERDGKTIPIALTKPTLNLTAPLRAGLAAFKDRRVILPEVNHTTPMIHYRLDTLAQLADPKLTPERYAELRMELCTKSSQFRAATALWQRLLQGEWPGFEGATVPKDQAPATIPADSPIRRLYLLALIDATKHPQIHGHPMICQTAAQIAPVLTKEMMATPTISLAMMSLMQTLAKDNSPAMSAPRAALLKRLEEVATKEWLAVLRESAAK